MKIAILGTVGVPGRYGGFETLAENLVRYHDCNGHLSTLTVWCSSNGNTKQPACFKSAELRYVDLQANGRQSVPYDVVSLWQAIRTGHDRIVLLGVSGALALPFVRLFSRARILTNIDGIEWKRKKWKGFARIFLRVSEWAAVRFSHEVIADNQAIAEYVRKAYSADCHVIAYGGDHAVQHAGESEGPVGLPESYALALCRIEPENNIDLILEAWARIDSPLVFVGNWSISDYGRDLKGRFGSFPNLHLLDPIYEPGELNALRNRATMYLHGHSAGGTNPSLVEMMHFEVPVLAYDCDFNRYSTEGKAQYFTTSEQLVMLERELTSTDRTRISTDMYEIAQRCYTWDIIGGAYFRLLEER